MSREILFRGKRTDGKGWALGIVFSYQRDDGGERAVIIQQFAPLSKSVDCVSVDPATIGQYTGLKDRNGKRIFEGDIVSRFEWWNGNHENAVVKMEHGQWIERVNSNRCCSLYGDTTRLRSYEYKFEVIGNIHDNKNLLNPELLNGEQP